MTLKLTFLGTGTSAGIPLIGCHCDVCSSDNPKNNRTRPSVMISYAPLNEGKPKEFAPIFDALAGATRGENMGDIESQRKVLKRFVIDTGPDFRQQMIRHQVDFVDGIFYTHTHADHIYGMDDLRRYNAVLHEPISIYSEPSALEALRKTFHYIFNPRANVNNSFIATLIPVPVEAAVGVDLFGATWTPLRLMHGRLPILGYRVDLPRGDGSVARIAYCTDVSAIPPETFPLLEDLDVLVIDGLRYRHHPTHMTVDQALQQIEYIQPKQAYLTHIAHEIDHDDLNSKLPDGVSLPFDGLEIDI